MSAEIIKLLRKTRIFSTLDSDSLKKICDYFKDKTYSADEVLFKEGTLGDTLYIIKEGAIKITRAAKEGEEESSRSLRREGDIFGESGFIDESTRPVTAQAIKPTKVFQLSRSDFLTILNNDPLIAYQIVRVLSSGLKQADLQVIEELKEKNEQLQQAMRLLKENPERREGKDWLEQSVVSMEEGEAFLDRILSSAPYPIVCAGEDDNITFFNKAAEKQFGHAAKEMAGKPIGMLWSGESWSRLCRDIKGRLAEESRWEGQIIAQKNNGEHFLSYTTITQMKDTDGKNTGRLYLCQNITQRKIQEKVERIREDSALRQQIAEEIGNAVRKEVKRLFDVLETLPSEAGKIDSSESQKKMGIVRNALDNIRELITDLSGSSRIGLDKEPLDLESFFQEELLLLKSHEKFRDIAFATHFEQDTPKVNANRRQFQQMLYAVLDNSACALQPVTDRTRTVTIEVGRASQGSEVQIQISDNGMGISSADLSKIFKERFTTKKTGLGLGLVSVARVVEDHDGDIEVYSDEGTYTLFVIKLPAYQERKAPQPQHESALGANFGDALFYPRQG